MTDYSIEVRSLRTAAEELDSAGQRLSERWGRLKATVQGMGQPWGADDIGSLIGMSYQAIEAQADESYTSVAEDLADFAERLRAVADNHEKAEEKSITAVLSVSVDE